MKLTCQWHYIIKPAFQKQFYGILLGSRQTISLDEKTPIYYLARVLHPKDCFFIRLCRLDWFYSACMQHELPGQHDSFGHSEQSIGHSEQSISLGQSAWFGQSAQFGQVIFWEQPDSVSEYIRPIGAFVSAIGQLTSF